MYWLFGILVHFFIIASLVNSDGISNQCLNIPTSFHGLVQYMNEPNIWISNPKSNIDTLRMQDNQISKMLDTECYKTIETPEHIGGFKLEFLENLASFVRNQRAKRQTRT